MEICIYKVNCMTNMHMGSGEANYSIIDNEVQRDVVSGYPTMNASGIKGSLREFFTNEGKEDLFLEEIFGSDQRGREIDKGIATKPGKVKFFSGNLLARPMRVSKGSYPSVLVTTIRLLRQFFENYELLCPDDAGRYLEEIEKLDRKKNYRFLESEEVLAVENIEIEEKIGSKVLIDFIKKHLLKNKDDDFVIMNDEDFGKVSLPIVARNYLEDGESKNLWYEEIVPYESIFYFMALSNVEGAMENLKEAMRDNTQLIQFGANASVGYGYTKVSEWKMGGEEG